MSNTYKNVQYMARDSKSCATMILERIQAKQTVLFMDSFYLIEDTRV